MAYYNDKAMAIARTNTGACIRPSTTTCFLYITEGDLVFVGGGPYAAAFFRIQINNECDIIQQ